MLTEVLINEILFIANIHCHSCLKEICNKIKIIKNKVNIIGEQKMLYNCIKYIFYILKQVKKGKKKKKEMSKGKKEISDEMIKLDYKNRMDKFRPDNNNIKTQNAYILVS